MELFEALYTTRAMRRTSTDPVPDEVVAAMLDAAVRAPSGSNAQNWRFLTVTDQAVKDQLGPLYREAWTALNETIYAGARERAEEVGDDQSLRMMNSSDWLAENFERVPLWLMVFSRNDPSGASIYPAVWNAMLAARGHGIGTCLTTILGMFRQAEVFEVLGVPADKGWTMNAAVSAGYPTGRWGLAKRKPAHLVAFAERWDQSPAFTIDEPLWQEG
ncbi:MAG: nitroreductase family protein [Acidimicrobiia bacterium]